MKVFHDEGGAVRADDGHADAGDRWGTMVDFFPSVVERSELGSNMVEFSRYARASEPSSASHAPVMVAPAGATERPDLKTEIERLLTEGYPELAAERFLSAILTAGLAATLDDRAKESRQREMPGLNVKSVLTRREREVAALIAAGRTNRSIAYELYIAQSTVERHVANMLNKLGFRSRTQIAAWAVTNGIASAA